MLSPDTKLIPCSCFWPRTSLRLTFAFVRYTDGAVCETCQLLLKVLAELKPTGVHLKVGPLTVSKELERAQRGVFKDWLVFYDLTSVFQANTLRFYILFLSKCVNRNSYFLYSTYMSWLLILSFPQMCCHLRLALKGKTVDSYLTDWWHMLMQPTFSVRNPNLTRCLLNKAVDVPLNEWNI